MSLISPIPCSHFPSQQQAQEDIPCLLVQKISMLETYSKPTAPSQEHFIVILLPLNENIQNLSASYNHKYGNTAEEEKCFFKWQFCVWQTTMAEAPDFAVPEKKCPLAARTIPGRLHSPSVSTAR